MKSKTRDFFCRRDVGVELLLTVTSNKCLQCFAFTAGSGIVTDKNQLGSTVNAGDCVNVYNYNLYLCLSYTASQPWSFEIRNGASSVSKFLHFRRLKKHIYKTYIYIMKHIFLLLFKC